MSDQLSTSTLRTDDDHDDPLGGKLVDQSALAVSGGGFKAAAYHLGGFIRLNELGMLKSLACISSVSGGSIASGFLASRWASLNFDGQGVAGNLTTAFVQPLVAFLETAKIDIASILDGLMTPRSAVEDLIAAYDKYLFQGATLQDLPDEQGAPKFIFCATNYELNSLWRLSKDYASDYRVGAIKAPRFSLAQVVAASSGFPPFFSPSELDLAGIAPTVGADRSFAPYNSRALVMDGGVYDNMGLEPIWKGYKTLLVSNAGNAIDEHPTGHENWIAQLQRTVSLIHRQAENNRVRWLLALARAGERKVALWALRGTVDTFKIPGTIALSPAEVEAAGLTPVRLTKLDKPSLTRLVWHGYSMCDGAVRRWLLPNPVTPARPPAFPVV